MKKFAVTVGLSAAIIAVGAGITFSVWAIKLGTPEEIVEKEALTPSVSIRVLETATVEDRLILTGAADAWQSVTTSAETSGKIEWQGIEEGQIVEAGAELIRINTTSARARMAQANAQFKLAEQDLNRVRDLRKEGISSPQELDRALANHDAASANHTLARIELDQSVITAQIGGVVDVLYKEEGEYVTTGTPLVRIVQIDRVKILTGIPERDVSHFAAGDPVTILIDAFPDRTFTGSIHRIATTSELAARTFTFTAEISVDNRDGALKPGMMARAIFVRDTFHDAITIPMFAVVTYDDERFVFVENGGFAESRPVEVGFFQGDYIHVVDGVAPGERLIVAGHRELRDGQAVDVVRDDTE